MNKSEAGKMGAAASAEIIAALKQARIDAYYVFPKTCETCRAIIPYEKRTGKFCSRSCAAKLNNSLKPKRKSGYTAFCKRCNVQLKDRKQRDNIFCSSYCHNEYKKEQNLIKFNNGEATAKSAKSFLIEQYGHKCMECGWDKINPTSNTCPVELEHLDGNSNNNLPSNLKLLCPNCHSLTSTYKVLNYGSGRHSRRERYHNNQSW